MDQKLIVEDFLRAIEKDDIKKAETLLSWNCKITGLEPDPIIPKEYLMLQHALKAGIPDLKLNHKIVREKNNVVEIKLQLTGTQTKTIPEPIPGMKEIQPTNKTLKMPEEPVQITLKENKIEEIRFEKVQGGGLQGILKQLGVEMPAEMHHLQL